MIEFFLTAVTSDNEYSVYLNFDINRMHVGSAQKKRTVHTSSDQTALDETA